MLRKIISIRNIGRFRNSAAPGNPELSRHTLIVGANGFGKTTLCAVLRSLKTGDPSHIAGRRTLGVEDPPNVELLLPSGPTRFDGTAWTAPYPARRSRHRAECGTQGPGAQQSRAPPCRGLMPEGAESYAKDTCNNNCYTAVFVRGLIV